jgi:hypothetical protein
MIGALDAASWAASEYVRKERLLAVALHSVEVTTAASLCQLLRSALLSWDVAHHGAPIH